MKRISVVSSNIKSIGYDPQSQILEIEFSDGGVYDYHGVLPATYQDFLKSESYGKFFHTNIKKNFEFKRVELDMTADQAEEKTDVKDPSFSRNELRYIRDRAIELSKVPGINPLWKRAYLRMASAADSLDAMVARSMNVADDIEESLGSNEVGGEDE